MALIKKNEFRQLNIKQLQDKVVELRKELMKLNAQIRVGTTLESPGKPKLIKKTIARAYTLLTQKKHIPVVAPQPPSTKLKGGTSNVK